MEKEIKEHDAPQSTTFKFAELATIIYAVLVFMSLLVDSAYYRQFNISIVSYMSASEILLSCIEQIPNYIKPLMTFLIWFVVSYVLTSVFMTAFNRKKEQTFLEYLSSLYLPSDEDIYGKLRIIWMYNIFALYLPLCCFFACDPSIWSIPINKMDFWMIMFFPLLMSVVLLVTAVIIRKLLYSRSSQRLTPQLIKTIDKVYSLRIFIIIILFCVGLFTSQMLTETKRAVLVKDVGTGKNVLLEGQNIHMDTRVDNINYVGESSESIFLYDKASKATIIYDRKQITNYQMFPGTINKED